MANLELITGHGEADHISSFDMRASNRATFGKGKYILTDADNMTATVNTDEKTLTISAGSCMWSGMHIRNESAITVPFVSPATSNPVYYWLHYTRNSNLVESVEIVSTTAMTVNADLIYDELPDDVTEAYTLFCSFSFNPNGNAVSIFKNEFKLVSGMSSFYDETTQRLNAQNAEVVDKLDSYDTYLANYESQIPSFALVGFQEPTLLWSGTIQYGASAKQFSASDYPSNYLFLLVRIERYSSAYFEIFVSPKSGTRYVSTIQTGDTGTTFYEMYINSQFTSRHCQLSLDAYRHSKGTLGGLDISELSGSTNVEIYGVGKIK